MWAFEIRFQFTVEEKPKKLVSQMGKSNFKVIVTYLILWPEYEAENIFFPLIIDFISKNCQYA